MSTPLENTNVEFCSILSAGIRDFTVSGIVNSIIMYSLTESSPNTAEDPKIQI